MYQIYRSEKCFCDKEWLPFVGETEWECRQAAAAGGLLVDVGKVYIAQVERMLVGIQPVPENALFVGMF